VDDDYRIPGVEDAVGDDSSDRRAANHIVSVEIAAKDAVVEVVGHAVIVHRADVARDGHVVTEVVVIRVHVRSRFRAVSRGTCMTIVLRSGLWSSLTMLVISSLRAFVHRCSGG